MGPFVSSQHPAILSGNVDMSPERYFAEYISKPLAKHQDRYPKEMQILLVPSLQDVVHETVVMPQPAFEHPRALGLPAVSHNLLNRFAASGALPLIRSHSFSISLGNVSPFKSGSVYHKRGRICSQHHGHSDAPQWR